MSFAPPPDPNFLWKALTILFFIFLVYGMAYQFVYFLIF